MEATVGAAVGVTDIIDPVQKLLLEIYPLTRPGKDMSFSKFCEYSADMYSTFSLKHEYTYQQYLEEMLKRFKYQASIYQ